MAARDLHREEPQVKGGRRGERGYTLAEMLTVLVIFGIVLTLTTVTFNRIVSNSSRIMKSEQTEIEGMIGLEVLRLDLENAGLGLPWSYRTGGWSGYSEAETGTTAAQFNEGIDGNGVFQAPRAIIVASALLNGSDYLVLKGTALGATRSARKWSYLTYGSMSSAVFKPRRADTELVLGEEPDGSTTPNGGPWSIVVKDTVKEGVVGKELVMDGTDFVTRFNSHLSAPFFPQRPQDRHVVYGVHDDTDDGKKPVRPFNRADYYLASPSTRPARCAPGTLTLYKKVLDVDGGTFSTSYPLLDCVADLKVVVGLGSSDGEEVDRHVGDLLGYDAQDIREQVKDIRVYLLAQDGVRDNSYLYPVKDESAAVVVGNRPVGEEARVWSSSQMSARFGPDWRHYRWKLFRVVVQPKNLQ